MPFFFFTSFLAHPTFRSIDGYKLFCYLGQSGRRESPIPEVLLGRSSPLPRGSSSIRPATGRSGGSSPIPSPGSRIPGLNRSHSNLEVQLAELLELAQQTGGECSISQTHHLPAARTVCETATESNKLHNSNVCIFRRSGAHEFSCSTGTRR